MPTITITCPSGLAGEVRGLKVSEGRILSDKNLIKSAKLMDKILETCWVSTAEAGPIYQLASAPNGAALAPDWSKVLVGDRFYALLKIREASYGDGYVFKVVCDNGRCEEPFEWELEISKLPVRKLSKVSAQRFLDGNRFDATFAGRRVAFKLLTGADEVRIAQQRKLLKQSQAASRRNGGDQANVLVEAVIPRIIEVEGVDVRALRAFLEDQDLADLENFVDDMDFQDCGVDTEIEVQCPECDNLQRVALPFAAGLFSPEGKPKRKKANQVTPNESSATS